MYIHVGYIMSIDCVSLSFPGLWQFLKLPLFWWPWVLRNTGHVFCRMSISRVCLILDRLWISRRKTTEVKCHSYHIISRVHAISMTYYWWCSPWPEADFVSFLCFKVTLSRPFYILYFLEVDMQSPHLNETELSSVFLKEKHLHKSFGILLYTFVCSHSLISHSLESPWTHGYLLYTLGCNPVWHNIFCSWNYSSCYHCKLLAAMSFSHTSDFLFV